MIKVGVVGGTGYTGVELLRLLAAHPQVEVDGDHLARGGGRAGRRLLSRRCAAATTSRSRDPAKAPLKGCDCVFFATPNGVAMSQARALLERARASSISPPISASRTRPSGRSGTRSRMRRPSCFAEAVYGLPEVNRETHSQGAPRGQSRLLCDRGAAGAAAAGGDRVRGSRATSSPMPSRA